MISVLAMASVICGGVLVLALALILVVIATLVWRISAALRETHAALLLVRDRTAPLRQHLAGLATLTMENVERVDRAVLTIEGDIQQITAPLPAARAS